MPLRLLLAALFGLFTLDNVLLLGFLGHAPALVATMALSLPPVLFYLVMRALPAAPRISQRTLAVAFVAAVLLLLLGGEGRLFFATDDWQIRDAVLADMGLHRWPFDYWLEGKAQMLRAPVGMYLVPALLGGASQLARDWALFAQNSLILTAIFASGAVLFEGARARMIALVIFVAFSGLDVIGNMLELAVAGATDWEHLERWANNHQFSSHITQLFWVPQHAFASWTCALLYLLWRRRIAPVGLFAGSIPLVALWSPFAIFGALPFALLAGVELLRTGRWSWRDGAFAAMAAAISLPAIIYLRIDASTVGSGLRILPALLYPAILLLEVAPFLLPLLRSKTGEIDRPTILVVAIWLAFVPLWGVGPASDFQMRASIMALALLALAFADWAIRARTAPARSYVVVILALGSVTGSAELYRAIMVAPSPAPLCSVPGVWMQQTNTIVPYASYFAARNAFPAMLAPVPPVDRAGGHDPARCWDRPWREKTR